VNSALYIEKSSKLLERLGVRIRCMRRKKGWTQEVFAEKANINDKEVTHIEFGRRNITIETLVKIAIAFDVEPILLLSDDPL